MAFFSKYPSTDIEITTKQIILEYGSILVENEKIEKAVKIERDKLICTNYRILLITLRKNGKYEFLSVPYSSIKTFSMVGDSVNDVNAELNIWIINAVKPITTRFRNSQSARDIYQIVGKYIFAGDPVNEDLILSFPKTNG
ncbi:PH domain-containing protein [Pedobacter sp. P351]|uniref:PH domain-containing protein n=1 Tax=Pedobacter superstes TaxID=3133441 RepID=UPI0030AF2094